MRTVQNLLDIFLRQRQRELGRIDVVVGVSRGGLIPAAIIATRLNKPLVAAYIDRQDHVYVDRGAWLKNKRILLVDDIIRTGKTFQKIKNLVSRQRPSRIRAFTLFCLSSATIQPDWTTFTATDRRFPWDRSRV